jgi:nicotinate dehydrogenase subunit A
VSELEVNGQLRAVDAPADTPLLYVLRNDLGLTGTKLGCGLEQCGACTVLLDGEPRLSCRLPLGEALGHSVRTVEGLGTAAAPHPLQRAFLAENAAQCGYCTAGILVRASALLEQRPDPGEAEIRSALRDHLCRCGAHNRVVRAIRRAARERGAR